MNADRMPLPRFWYLPRGEKAVVVMSGDDHSPGNAPGGTAFAFDRFKELSPPAATSPRGSASARARTSIPTARSRTRRRPPTSPRASRSGCTRSSRPARPRRSPRRSWARSSTRSSSAWAAHFTSIPAPVSSRTHCVYWPDWASRRRSSSRAGSGWTRNYYHYPTPWIGARPGFMNGGGFPMRFADTDGRADRRLPAEHEHERRGDDELPSCTSTRCSTTRSARTGTTAPSA